MKKYALAILAILTIATILVAIAAFGGPKVLVVTLSGAIGLIAGLVISFLTTTSSPQTRSGRGFTLVELLIVVAIIAILAAIAVPNLLEAQIRSKVSRAKADLKSMATAMEAYRVDNHHYPTAFIITTPGVGYAIYPRIQRLVGLTTPIAYITSIPNDPFSKGKPAPDNCPTLLDRTGYMASGHYGADPQPDLNGMIIPHFINGNRQWTLMNLGPTQKRVDLTVLDPSEDEYDPTNGTISMGFITRWGP